MEKKDTKDSPESLAKTKDSEQKKKDDADNQLQSAINVIKGIKVYRGFTAAN